MQIPTNPILLEVTLRGETGYPGTLDAKKVKEPNCKRRHDRYQTPFAETEEMLCLLSPSQQRCFTEDCPGTGLPGGAQSCRKGERVAFPSIGIVVEEEQVGKGFQQGQSCFGSGPTISEHESYQWDSPAFG
jgi:hypothetical protein